MKAGGSATTAQVEVREVHQGNKRRFHTPYVHKVVVLSKNLWNFRVERTIDTEMPPDEVYISVTVRRSASGIIHRH